MAPLEHEEAGRVDADVVEQLVEGDEVAAALRHLRSLAAVDDVDELHDRELEQLGVQAEGGEPRPQPGHVAVVVRAEHVEQPAAAALELVAVVGDVGQEVGGLAAGADQHPVLVVAEGGGAQPGGAVGLVDLAARLQLPDEGVQDVAVVQRALGEPGVELDAVALQRRLGGGAHPLGTLPGELAQVVGAHALGLQGLGELRHVGALVPVLGGVLAPHPRGDRLGEPLDLPARVVDVVLAQDLVAAQLHRARDGVPVRGVAPAGRGQGAGRVRRDELDQEPVAARRRAAPDVVAGRRDGRKGVAVPGVREEEVDETRAGDLEAVDLAPQVAAQPLDEALGDRTRVVAQRSGQQHGCVARVVAHLGARRALQGGGGPATLVSARELAGGARDRELEVRDGIAGGHEATLVSGEP